MKVLLLGIDNSIGIDIATKTCNKDNKNFKKHHKTVKLIMRRTNLCCCTLTLKSTWLRKSGHRYHEEKKCESQLWLHSFH